MTVEVELGNIIWQRRMPGGECLVIEIFETRQQYDRDDQGWPDHDWPILRVLHPTEGIVDDPSYYYETINGRWL